MNGLRAATPGGLDDLLHVQVRLAGCGRADGISLVGFAYVEGGAIHIRENSDGGDAQFTAGANHAHGYFATIGYENFLEHRRRNDSTKPTDFQRLTTAWRATTKGFHRRGRSRTWD